MKKLALAISAVAFVGLCGFKAANTNNDLLVSKAEQVKQEKFNKLILDKVSTVIPNPAKYSTPTLVTVVLFAVAVTTPTYGRIPTKPTTEVAAGIDVRLNSLDSK